MYIHASRKGTQSRRWQAHSGIPTEAGVGVTSLAFRDWIPIQGAGCPKRRAGFWIGTEKIPGKSVALGIREKTQVKTKQTSKQTKAETTKTNKPKTGSPCDLPKRDLDAKTIGFGQQK